MFTMKFAKVQKRVNSTLVPDTANWTTLDNVIWKTGLDVDVPTVQLRLTTDPVLNGAIDWNMAYIPWTDTYYWITSIKNVSMGLWELSLTMDVLATYKEYIINTSCYVAYGFNEDASGAEYRLQDTRQNVSNVPIISTTAFNMLGGGLSPEVGVFILAAVGASDGVSTWVMDKANLKKLVSSLNGDVQDALEDYVNSSPRGWSTSDEIAGWSAVNSIYQGNAMSAIRSCFWAPVKSAIYGGATHNVYLGDFNTYAQGKEAAMGNWTNDFSISIPWGDVSDWKRLNCQIQIYLPFIGNVAVAADKINGHDSLYFKESYSYVSGEYSISIWAGDFNVFTGTTNFAVPYAIGSSNVTIQQFMSGMSQAIGGAVTVSGGVASGNAAGIIGGGLGIANGIVQAITPTVQSTGSVGGSSATGLDTQGKITVLYYKPIDDAGFEALYGHPVMRVTKPVAGYCQTVGFPVSVPARAAEQAQIATMMDGGVFIE